MELWQLVSLLLLAGILPMFYRIVIKGEQPKE